MKDSNRFNVAIPKNIKDYLSAQAVDNGVNITDFTKWVLTNYCDYIQLNSNKDFLKHLLLFKEKSLPNKQLSCLFPSKDNKKIKIGTLECSTSKKSFTIAAIKFYRYKKENHDKEIVDTKEISIN